MTTLPTCTKHLADYLNALECLAIAAKEKVALSGTWDATEKTRLKLLECRECALLFNALKSQVSSNP